VEEQGILVATPPDPARSPVSPAEPRQSSTAPPRRSRARVVVGIGLLILGGSAGAYYFAEDGRKKGEENSKVEPAGEHKTGSGLPVEVTHPRQGGIERKTTQYGSVHAFEHAALYAKVSGYLRVQNVDIGDRVKLGELLAVIDDPEVDKAVEQNQAALDQAKAKIRSAQAAKEASEAMVKQSQAMISSKTSNQELERKQLTRISGLVARGAVEDKLKDEQQDRYDVAASNVGVVKAEVISAQAEVMNKAAMVEEAQADLVEAQANVELAQANLSKAKVMQEYTRITSPYDGLVTTRSYHRGDFIRSASEGGSVPVLAVARTDLMRVVLPIPDTDVPFTDKGDEASIRFDALPGKKFSGKISRFSGTEDPESRNMRTEVDLPNPDNKLREGMYGPVTVILQAAAPNSVTIPSSGLLGQTGTGEGSVYTVRDDKAHKVDVHVGNDNGVETEVLSGLSPEDQVITSYNGSIAEGTPVKAETKKSAQAAH